MARIISKAEDLLPHVLPEKVKRTTAVQDLLGDGRLTKELIRTGAGKRPHRGSRVRAHYVCSLPSGREVRTTRERGRPFEFLLGQPGRVVEGLDRAIATMRPGEISRFRVSADLSRGRRADTSPTRIRGAAAAAARRVRGNTSRRRRGGDVDSPWRRVAATPRLRRG